MSKQIPVARCSIAGGNVTALTRAARPQEKVGLARQLLKSPVEQVGFLWASETADVRLEMMGDELCVNAAMAAAYVSGLDSGTLELVGGVIADFVVSDTLVRLRVPLEYEVKSVNGNRIILFGSIGYIIVRRKGSKADIRRMLKDLCDVYNLPAFGLIEARGLAIRPIIYVAAVRSLLYETACGSGSIAYAVATQRADKGCAVVQPTGETIAVRLQSPEAHIFDVSARVQNR